MHISLVRDITNHHDCNRDLRSLCSCCVVFEFRIMNGEIWSKISSVLQRMNKTDQSLDGISTKSGRGGHHYQWLRDREQ